MWNEALSRDYEDCPTYWNCLLPIFLAPRIGLGGKFRDLYFSLGFFAVVVLASRRRDGIGSDGYRWQYLQDWRKSVAAQ